MGISFVEKYEKMSDDELAVIAKRSDSEAGVVLLKRYTGLIKSRAVAFYNGAVEMEDLMQEGIIALYQCIKSFNPEVASFSTFARLCVDRALIAESRAVSRKKRIPKDKLLRLDDVEPTSTFLSPEEMLIRTEDASNFKNNLRTKLSKLEYKTLMLYLHNFSVAETAAALVVSEKSVNNALYRIRNKLSHL